MPGHTVGGGGIKAVAAEKLPRGALGGDGAVEKQGAPVGVAGAEADVMAHHHHRHPGGAQAAQNGRQLLLKGNIQSLGGLVQQQDPGLQQQHLGQGCPLLLAPGQVKGMTVQKGLQVAQACDPAQPGGLFLFGKAAVPKGVGQVLAHGAFYKQGPGVLGQHPQNARRGARVPSAGHKYLAPVGLVQPRQQGQGGGFSRAVASQNRQQLPGEHLQAQPPGDVRGVLLVAEPDLLQLCGRTVRYGRGDSLRGHRPQGMAGGKGVQPVPALPHGHRAGKVVVHPGVDTHGGGHGGKHPVAPLLQGLPHLSGAAPGDELSAVQHQHLVAVGEDLLQPVLGAQDGGAQLPVDAGHRRQKVRSGDGVQLGGGLVQNQHTGLHHHNGSQVQKLLLSAGKLGNIPVKPVLDAEKAGHLRHPAADGGGVAAQALQAEGQLVPHLVGDDLVVRILQHEADAGALLPPGQGLQGLPLKQDAPLPEAVGGQGGLELPQQGGLSAAGGAAQGDKGPRPDGQADAIQGFFILLGIGKAQIFQRKAVHFRSSLRSRITGTAHSAR